MKRLTFLAMLIAMVLSASAQYYMHVWSDGAWVSWPVLNVDSVTFTDGPLENVPNEPQEPTPVVGVFSVGEGKTVTFSPGNLQYHPANDEWRFAANQADYVGSANSNISATYNGWIDLFGWGTGNAPTKSSTDYIDYQTFVDWGTNQIGSDAPNTWRTLSKDEWVYIFYNRPNAQSLFALGSVNGVNGTIILPDNWTTPAGVSFVASTTNGLSWQGSDYFNSNGTNYGDNTYTSEQWSKMEQAGAVFLPSSGYRWGTVVYGVGYVGYYWSSTENNAVYAYDVYFSSSYLFPQNGYDRILGFSVRLVKDVEGETTEPGTPPTNTENGHEYVDLGLSVKWATCNIGANSPEKYGDYFAWDEVEPKEVYDWNTYKWCNGSSHTLTKYCTDNNYGTVDNKTVLDAADDAATANWGGSWRMPTDAELTELREQCTWTRVTQNGVKGFKVTSKKSGYTNKSIFLPAAGSRLDSSLRDPVTYGFYWSSSLSTENPDSAWYVSFTTGVGAVDSEMGSLVGRYDYYRNFGFSVRPVCQ